MQKFSAFEKKILRTLVDLDKDEGSLVNLANVIEILLDEGVPDYCFIQINSANDVVFKIKNDQLDKVDEAEEIAYRVLIPTILLFHYLEESGLAYFTGNLKASHVGKKNPEAQYKGFAFLDDEVEGLIYKYTGKQIYLSETLRVYVGNGFMAEEDLRHEIELDAARSQLKMTRLALVITFLGLLASILVPLFSTTNVRILNESAVFADGLVGDQEAASALRGQGAREACQDESREPQAAATGQTR